MCKNKNGLAMYRGIKFILAVIFLSAASLSATAFETIARNAYVIDVSTGAVLLDKDSQVSMPPASTSKLMTIALLFEALEEGRISLDSRFEVSEKAWRMGGSKMFLEVGDLVSIEDLIRGIVIQSGNDACVVVAEGLAGSEQNFAEDMNRYAREIGLENSSFSNASGWPHPNQRMSAQDLANLAYHLFQTYPQHLHYYAEREFTYNNITQANRNPLLGVIEGADGFKTGHTQEAGYSLVGSVKRGDRHILMVLMGMTSEAERAAEAERVATWALSEFQSKILFKAGEPILTAPTWQASEDYAELTSKKSIEVLVPSDDSVQPVTTAHFDQPIVAPKSAGEVVGKITIHVEGLQSVSEELVLRENLERGSFISRLTEVIGAQASSYLGD